MIYDCPCTVSTIDPIPEPITSNQISGLTMAAINLAFCRIILIISRSRTALMARNIIFGPYHCYLWSIRKHHSNLASLFSTSLCLFCYCLYRNSACHQEHETLPDVPKVQETKRRITGTPKSTPTWSTR